MAFASGFPLALALSWGGRGISRSQLHYCITYMKDLQYQCHYQNCTFQFPLSTIHFPTRTSISPLTSHDRHHYLPRHIIASHRLVRLRGRRGRRGDFGSQTPLPPSVQDRALVESTTIFTPLRQPKPDSPKHLTRLQLPHQKLLCCLLPYLSGNKAESTLLLEPSTLSSSSPHTPIPKPLCNCPYF